MAAFLGAEHRHFGLSWRDAHFPLASILNRWIARTSGRATTERATTRAEKATFISLIIAPPADHPGNVPVCAEFIAAVDGNKRNWPC
jgi:hypothetical protein